MGINSGRLESAKDSMVVPMGGHVGAPDPSNQVSHTAMIEMEEGGSSHSDPLVIDNSLRLPTRGETANAAKGNVLVVGPQIAEDGSRIVNRTEDVSRIRVAGVVMEKPRLKKREQHMLESWSQIKILQQVVLTKGLLKLCSNTGVNNIQGSHEPAFGCLCESLLKGGGRQSGNNGFHGIPFIGALDSKAQWEEVICNLVIRKPTRASGETCCRQCNCNRCQRV
jgi:hypothetical protein